MANEILRAIGIRKSFAGVHALRGVDFRLERGASLGLVGENGAGKSTLMKILSGVYPAGQFEGEIVFESRPIRLRGTKDAESLGIAIIHQELNLFPELSVAENMFMSHLPVGKIGRVAWKEMLENSRAILQPLGVEFDPEDRVGDLETGNQQLVEIAKALSLKAKVLILDEPTSSLTLQETQRLFRILKDLRAQGVSLIYISHKLEEVEELCEDVTVLRDGATVFSGKLEGLGRHSLVNHMVGRELDQYYPPKPAVVSSPDSRHPIFEVKNWNAFKISERRMRVKDVSFSLYQGEIAGISGMTGAGRTDLLLSLFGHPNYISTGEVKLNGEKVFFKNPGEAVHAGLGLVTEDRKRTGVHLQHSIFENIGLAGLWRFRSWKGIRHRELRAESRELSKALHIRMGSEDDPVSSLSGGNQQKVVLAKWLATKPKVLFLDEPTRGIDVGAKFEIYSLLREISKQGVAILVVSSELPEIMGICDRVRVMRSGKLVGNFCGEEINSQNLVREAIAS